MGVATHLRTTAACSVHRRQRTPLETMMEIAWRHDIDRVLEDARAQNRHVLLDFSAAPM